MPPDSPQTASPDQGITAFLNPAEMHKLGRLTLASRYIVEGNLAGAHRSPLRGPSSEFADHKSYDVGDDPKHIDWRVLARTDKYFVKRFEDETNLRVYLALDRSASMGYTSGAHPTKFAFASHLAAALGYVIVKARDSVGLFLHSHKIDLRLDAGSSLAHLNNMLKHIQTLPPASTSGIGEALHEIAGTVRRRALVVVISDLLGDEAAVNVALSHLRKQRHDVIVFQILDPAEIDLSFATNCELRDLENGEVLTVNPRGMGDEYRRVFGAFLEQYRKACAGMNIDYRLVRTDQPVESFVRAYLEERRRLSK
ncbi:MAG TPA: DUF58 domain-containing protein [Chthoniobacteraceae bacterium]|jgi:uncharacterized protein (DUF58 family)|nr:DUF58 domain-containing protein [Chthoniobacteraceae bacterium]